MELRHLRSFLAVAEAGSVTRAATTLFIAQSALSTQIAQLELDVGNQLFVRTHRGVRLTPAGEALVPRAERLLADVDAVNQEQAALRGILQGRLRLGTIQGLPARFDVTALVTEFHRRHPDVELIVRTGVSDRLAVDVAEGRLDAAVVAIRRPRGPAGLVLTPLLDDPLVAVVPIGSVPVRRRNISVADLFALGEFICYQRDSGLRHSVDEALARAGVSFAPRFELDQMGDMVGLVAAGVGVTLLPSSVAPSTADDRTTVLRVTDENALHTVSFAATSAPTLTARAVLDLLCDVV